MKKIPVLFAALLLAAGCQAPKSVPMPPTSVGGVATAAQTQAIVDTQASLEKQLAAARQAMRELERQLGAQTEAGARTQAHLTRAYDDLKASALEMKSIRDRIDGLQSQLKSNLTAVAMLELRVKSTADEIKQMESQMAGTPAQLAELRRQLDKERQERAAAAEMAKQKEREIEALRRDLAAQKRLVEDGRKAAPAPAATAPPAEPQRTAATPHEDAIAWVAQADRLLKESKPAEAKPLYEAALKARPAMVSALVGLAACQYLQDDLITATRTAERALDIDKGSAQALGVMGLIYRKEGQFSSASSVLDKAVRLDPNDARLRNYYGIALSDRQRSREAIEQFAKACEIEPGYAEAHFNLAFLLATAAPPRLDEARQHYRTAVALGAARDTDLDKLLGAAPGDAK